MVACRSATTGGSFLYGGSSHRLRREAAEFNKGMKQTKSTPWHGSGAACLCPAFCGQGSSAEEQGDGPVMSRRFAPCLLPLILVFAFAGCPIPHEQYTRVETPAASDLVGEWIPARLLETGGSGGGDHAAVSVRLQADQSCQLGTSTLAFVASCTANTMPPLDETLTCSWAVENPGAQGEVVLVATADTETFYALRMALVRDNDAGGLRLYGRCVDWSEYTLVPHT
jgi:hypothetical protein